MALGGMLPVFPSRKQVQRSMRSTVGGIEHSLFIIDSRLLDADQLVILDYDHVFYKGVIPSRALKLLHLSFVRKRRGGYSGTNHR